MKLTNICFSQYKRFSSQETLEIKPVTILVGKNSSGKSSITKLIPILGKAISGEDLITSLVYGVDSNIDLGGSYKNLAHNGYLVELSFGVSFSDGLSIEVTLMDDKNAYMLINEYSVKYFDKTYELRWQRNSNNYICIQNGKEYSKDDLVGFVHKTLFKEYGIPVPNAISVDYIGPFRITPQTYFKFTNTKIEKVGTDGNLAYSMLYKDSVLVGKVSKWFEDNFNGCKLQLKRDPNDRTIFQVELQKPDNDNFWVNIKDEGQGMSQVLPIITRCLNPIKDSVIVMEEPELHLHPAAHESVAALLAQTAKINGHRYVVETHSENVILGIREAIVDPNIDFGPDDAVIYFIDEDEEGAYLDKITIDSEGVLSGWPEGVFNESYEILNRIIEKAHKQ